MKFKKSILAATITLAVSAPIFANQVAPQNRSAENTETATSVSESAVDTTLTETLSTDSDSVLSTTETSEAASTTQTVIETDFVKLNQENQFQFWTVTEFGETERARGSLIQPQTEDKLVISANTATRVNVTEETTISIKFKRTKAGYFQVYSADGSNLQASTVGYSTDTDIQTFEFNLQPGSQSLYFYATDSTELYSISLQATALAAIEEQSEVTSETTLKTIDLSSLNQTKQFYIWKAADLKGTTSSSTIETPAANNRIPLENGDYIGLSLTKEEKQTIKFTIKPLSDNIIFYIEDNETELGNEFINVDGTKSEYQFSYNLNEGDHKLVLASYSDFEITKIETDSIPGTAPTPESPQSVVIQHIVSFNNAETQKGFTFNQSTDYLGNDLSSDSSITSFIEDKALAIPPNINIATRFSAKQNDIIRISIDSSSNCYLVAYNNGNQLGYSQCNDLQNGILEIPIANSGENNLVLSNYMGKAIIKSITFPGNPL